MVINIKSSLSVQYKMVLNFYRVKHYNLQILIILHYLFHKSGILKFNNYEDICMRCSGTSYENIHFRNYNRYDRKFCNQPEDSDNDATFIHFCASRKNNLESYVKEHDL